MCRSFRSLDRRAWAPAHGDAGLGRQLAGEALSGRPCPRDPAMLASVVHQVPPSGFPVASLVGFIGPFGLFVSGFPCPPSVLPPPPSRPSLSPPLPLPFSS